MAYGETDRLTGGSCSSSSNYSSSNLCGKAIDDDAVNTWWASNNSETMPQWWKYDFGAGTSWAIGKLRMASLDYDPGPNAFTVHGSNNDSDWTELYSGNKTEPAGFQDFTWENSTEYRYIRVTITSVYGGNHCTVREFEAFEQLAVSGGILNWWFFKEAWQKHDKIWQPKLAIPNGYTM